jgi:hypothetical protein
VQAEDVAQAEEVRVEAEQHQHQSSGEQGVEQPEGSPHAVGGGDADGEGGQEGGSGELEVYSLGSGAPHPPVEDVPSSSNADQATGGGPVARGSTSGAAQPEQQQGPGSQGQTGQQQQQGGSPGVPRQQPRASAVRSSPWQTAASQPPPPQTSPGGTIEFVDLT